MPKDRDQLTPDDPEDRNEIHQPRSAAREALEDAPAGEEGREVDRRGSDPKAVDEVPASEKSKYK
jgi:hypothetical protein